MTSKINKKYPYALTLIATHSTNTDVNVAAARNDTQTKATDYKTAFDGYSTSKTAIVSTYDQEMLAAEKILTDAKAASIAAKKAAKDKQDAANKALSDDAPKKLEALMESIKHFEVTFTEAAQTAAA